MENQKEEPSKKKQEQTNMMMPKLAQIADRFGNVILFGNAGDFWQVPFPIGADNDYRTQVRRARDMEIRTDDVLICSYPKSGLHWQQEIINMLMKKTSKITDGETSLGFLDMMPIEHFSKLPSPRLLVTHVPYRYVPKQAFEKKIKIIYLDRNPKDVFVSFYNHMHKNIPPFDYAGSFEQFFYLNIEVGYMYGDLFDYRMEWQRGIESHPDGSVFTSIYEEMILDPIGGVKSLNRYVDTGCSDELCEEIASACSFDNMKQHKEKTVQPEFQAMFQDKKIPFYRKGGVGDWKNWFTDTMNEDYDKEYKKRMSEYKTVYKYTLDQMSSE
ncbi:sulfotransferase 1B1-like [Physella acuta]|uniref:sulfotransferase 1B1-like n=1 Tax=Physella acuta TaxID=109671 RepID=UPI0027DE34B8|nr:sulfotransferase 1B1-like [Physella acuta]